MLLTISLELNCSEFLLNGASKSQNGIQHQSIKYYTCIDTGASNQSLKLIETRRKALVVGDPSHGTTATASKMVSYFVIMNDIHRIKYLWRRRLHHHECFWINVNIIIYDSSCKIYTSSTTFSILFFKNIDYIWYLKPCSYHFWYGSLSLTVSHFQKKKNIDSLFIFRKHENIARLIQTLLIHANMHPYNMSAGKYPALWKGQQKGRRPLTDPRGGGQSIRKGRLCGPGHPWIRKYFVSCTVLNQQIKHIIKAGFTAFGTSMVTFGVVLVTSR